MTTNVYPGMAAEKPRCGRAGRSCAAFGEIRVSRTKRVPAWNVSYLLLFLTLFSASHGAVAQQLHRHFYPPDCTTEVSPIGADGIVLTCHIRLHGNVPDGTYSTTVVMGVGADGDQRQFAWQVTSGVATPLPGFPETGFIEDVQNGAIPGYAVTWAHFVQTLPFGFSGDALGFEAPVGVYVGSPLDVCDGAQGIYYGATFYWDVYADPVIPDPNQTKLNDPRTPCTATPMAAYSIHFLLASLHLEDTPISYQPPRGPGVDFKVVYNQREANQPVPFPFSNFGPKWTFNWLSYVVDDPTNSSADASVYVRGGGTEAYTDFNSVTQSYAADKQSMAVLVRTSSTSLEKRFPDGSREVFSQSDGAASFPRRIYLTSVIDPSGNAVTISYDSSFRVVSIVDALGQATTLSYTLAGDSLKITKVTDPFGRFATFDYTSGQLTKITDPIGIQSQFGYAPSSDFVNSLTTPYGQTTFAMGETGSQVRWLEATDPLGGKERVEYNYSNGIIPASEATAPPGVYNNSLNYFNTFFWDKKAMADAPGDYTKAQIFHWLPNADGTISGIKHSEKRALENRVWYTYAGQTDPSKVGSNALPLTTARVLADSSVQISQYQYNALGNVTEMIDPLGRVTSRAYDTNGIDVLTVYQRNPAGASIDPDGQPADITASYTYNSIHEPLTATDAAGQTTTYGYNSYGQLTSVQNAKGETTNYGYGDGTAGKPVGYLTSVTSPVFNGNSAVTTFLYDGANRVRTVTDTDGYATTTDYDNLDRKTKMTYPDGTFQQFQYTDNVTGAMTLDLTRSRDRRGLSTYRHYNANRQMDSMTDPQNRTTQYGWCTCGALTSITDPKMQTTTFNRDLQSRIYQKVFNDLTTIDYLYEGQSAPNTAGATSRLKSSTDAKSQRTNYTYFTDDNVQQITYTDTNGQPLNPPTPSVSFTYDSNYNRVATMVDGSGNTVYGYNPITAPPALGAGRLGSIDAPLPNDTITLSYDELGRVVNRSINGLANSETWSFDSLGRLQSDVNKLGSFTYSYVGVTGRLQTLTYPSGTTANYTYFPNLQDKRLQQIKNQTSASILLSQFDYTYDYEGEIKTWKKNYPGLSSTQRYDLTYDNADQLTNAPLRNDATNTLVRQYVYGYDTASNRTSERVGNQITTSIPNNVNEITSQSGATNRTLSYDLNGNLTDDGLARTFEWDADNRLIAINYTGTNNRSEFSYDGLDRCVAIVEKTNGTVTGTRKIVWCGLDKCEFRGQNNNVQVQIFKQGQYQGNAAYFYTRDHLGSVREMTDGSGTALARFDYDPWGRSTTVINTNKPDFNYTGFYNHAKSGLDLAVYRFYDPELGRWLSRDPLPNAERLPEGPNLYAYVANNPLNWTDPSGQGIWTFIKCALVAKRWQKNCFSKLPDCDTACGKTLEDQLLAKLACLNDRDTRLRDCLTGMNADLWAAGCVTVSVGAPPGYLRPPIIP